MTGRKIITTFFMFLFIYVTSLVIFPSCAVAVPPPWRISIYPEIVHIAPPHCKASFVINVESDYKDTPIQLLYDEWSEGTWAGPGTLISSAHYDGQRQYSSYPVASDYETVATINVVSPWQKPGVYKVRVYAFPEGSDPFHYSVYRVLTIVVEDTGIEKCDSDYWPPPPSDYEESTDIITDTTDSWPPYSDDTTDIVTDRTGEWRWWRWWRLDWKWWRSWWYSDSNVWANWWYRWWPWSAQEMIETGEAFNFYLEAVPSLLSIEPGHSVNYTINVRHLSGVSQPVVLSESGLPAETISSVSISSGNPTFSSVVTLDSDLSLPPGIYPFTVTGRGGGKSNSVNLSLIVEEGLEKSGLTLQLNPPTVQTNDEVNITGALSPPLVVPVELLFTRPDGFEMIKHVTTSPDGTFTDLFMPDKMGSWLIRARWFGDEDHFGCESLPAGLSVAAIEKQPSSWELMLGVLTVIIVVVIVIAIIILLSRKRKKANNKKGLQSEA